MSEKIAFRAERRLSVTLMKNEESSEVRREGSVEEKLKDAIELLHLWKDEACSYRQLIEAILSGRFSHAQAREAIRRHETGR